MKYILTLLMVVVFCSMGIGQTNWPVKPFDQQHSITGSIGECRESGPHFHMGLDITNGDDLYVYSMQTGTITAVVNTWNCWTSYIDITGTDGSRIRYFHIKPVSKQIIRGQHVEEGDQIGKMFSEGNPYPCSLHVHIEKRNGNFLNSELYPFVDNSQPIIGNTTFCLNGATFTSNKPALTSQVNINDENYLVLFSKIDIISSAHDTRLNETGGANGGFLAPFSLEYEIYNSNNQSVDNGPIQNYNFSSPPPKTYVKYAFKHGSTMSNFSYILTNDPNPTGSEPADKYFNTILRKSIVETWPNNSLLDAQYNGVTQYPDGIYKIIVRATDVDNGHNPRHMVSSSNKILIDNFRPYISNVTITEEGEGTCKYSRGWQWVNNSLLFEPEPPDIKFDNNKNVVVEVTSSEPMKSVSLKVGTYSAEQSKDNDLNKTTWEFTINKSQLTAGLHTLRFDGKDLAGNPVQSEPASIPIRQSNGSWTPSPITGEDTYHKFIYGNSTVDFTATQLGYTMNTIRFLDKSDCKNNCTYYWHFGDHANTWSSQKDVDKTYTNTGVYLVTHSVNNVEVSKYVSVNELSLPKSKFIYSPLYQSNGKEATDVKVNFFSTSEGIINSYHWDFGNGKTSTLKDPEGIIFSINTNYIVKLTVKNYAGHDTYKDTIYLDPTTHPFISIFDWELNYYLYDIDVSLSNFDLTQTVTYEIDYGDGTSEIFVGDHYSYHRFNHQYNTLGEFLIVASATGKKISGDPVTVSNAKRIKVYPDYLDVSLSYSSDNDPPYVLQNVKFTPDVYPSLAQGYWGFWTIFKIGDPSFYRSFSCTDSDPVLKYRFPEAGSYRIILDVSEKGGFGTGHAELGIEIENAPDYLDVSLYGRTTISQNTAYTFEAMLWPLGDPGVPESEWWPTDIRWTLFKPNGQTEIIHKKLEGYESQFLQYHQFNFPASGTYKLRLEAWNDQHEYTANQLNPGYVNSLSFYDFDELGISVSDNLPALSVISPNSPYIDNISSSGDTDIILKFTNPGSSPITWAVFSSNIECVLRPIPNAGNGLRSGAIVNLTLDVLSNPYEDSRYSIVTIEGKDINGNHVQGSPAYLTLYQNGHDGAWRDYIYGQEPGHAFGYSVSIDGLVMLIGAPAYSGKGKAFIFEKNQFGDWMKCATLLPTENNPNFGKSVDIFGDYVIISGEHSNNAYVYKKPVNGWAGNMTETKLINTSYNNCKNLNVTIWGDYAAIGAPYNADRGIVQIYYRNNGGIDNWGLVKSLNGPTKNDQFGESVELYNDVLAVGAPQGGSKQGFINIYDRNRNFADSWELIQTLQPQNNASSKENMKFGQRVSVFNDAIVSSYYGVFNGYGHHELHLPIWSRKNGNLFEFVDEGFFWLRYQTSSNCIGSISLFKDVRSSNPPEFKFRALYGSEVRNNTAGLCGWAGFSKSYGNHYSFDFQWLYEMYENIQGEFYGKSVSTSFNTEITGIPGYNRDGHHGAVVFQKLTNFESNYESEIDYTFQNFVKPTDHYSTVNARKINLGGEAMPAVIQSGASIKYEAGEIILRDGFVAERECIFTAQSIKPEQKGGTPIRDGSNVSSNDNLMAKNTDSQIQKAFLKLHPDFPWINYNLDKDINITVNKLSLNETDYNNMEKDVGKDEKVEYLGERTNYILNLPGDLKKLSLPLRHNREQ